MLEREHDKISKTPTPESRIRTSQHLLKVQTMLRLINLPGSQDSGSAEEYIG